MVSGCVFLYVMAGVFRLIDLNIEDFPIQISAISYLAICVICLVCIHYLGRDIPNLHARKYLIISVVILFIWQLIGMVKDVMYPEYYTINRYLWYSYYIPMLLIPNAIFIATRSAGLHNNQKIKSSWYLTIIPTLILIIGVMTNDLHQKAFRFQDGPSSFYLGKSYGPIFFIAMTWIFIMFGMIIGTLWSRIEVEKTKSYIWVVLLIIAVAAVYLGWRITGYKVLPWINDMYDIPHIWAGTIIIAMELSVRLGIVRSNYNFMEFFRASTMSSSLFDADGTVRYQTSGIIPFTYEQGQEALKHKVYLDKNHRLSGRYISGGYALWTDDLSLFNELNEKLSDTQEHLKEENNLIKAENEIIARRAKADERNKLYDLMAQSVSPELDKIEDLIKNTTPDSPDFKDRLSAACVYKAFIKRYCNLTLLSQDQDELSSFELENSIKESMQYIQLRGISCDLVKFGEGTYPAEGLLVAYSMFERAIVVATNMESVVVEIASNERGFRLNLHIYGENMGITGADFDDFDEQLNKLGGKRRILEEEKSFYLRLDIPKSKAPEEPVESSKEEGGAA